jgi:hypothetical protein
MKKLNVQDLFEYGRAAIAILRSLEVQQLTMSYAVPARGIHLRSNECKHHLIIRGWSHLKHCICPASDQATKLLGWIFTATNLRPQSTLS